MTPEQNLEDAVAAIYLTAGSLGSILTKPLFGGAFGSGEFLLGSVSLIEHGLHSARYLVIHALTKCPVSIGDTRQAALAQARNTLTSAKRDRLIRSMLAAHRASQEAQAEREQAAAREAQQAIRSAKGAQPRTNPVPKRRRQIFEASNGQCHYCGTTLTLDGRWHIEHKMPRALMGGNEPSNLVASCAPCNHKKRDMTDEEFIAKRNAA